MTAARLMYVLSPAKTLDMALSSVRKCSEPTLLRDAHTLVAQLQKLSQAKVKTLLGVSDALAKLNYQRFQSFDMSMQSDELLAPSDRKKQAVLAFNGPAFQGLAAHELSDDDLAYAQDHLRILCGLYGILRPLDLIQAYRLEMGQKFTNSRGPDLYAFWGDTLATELRKNYTTTPQATDSTNILVNLASHEYFRSLSLDALGPNVRVVDCVFQDDGKVKSVYAKRARGLMGRFLIQNRVESLDGVKAFDVEGYVYAPQLSSDATLVFTRTAATQKDVLKQIQARAKLAKQQQLKASSPSTAAAAAAESTRVKRAIKAESDGTVAVKLADDDTPKRTTRASTRKKLRAA